MHVIAMYVDPRSMTGGPTAASYQFLAVMRRHSKLTFLVLMLVQALELGSAIQPKHGSRLLSYGAIHEITVACHSRGLGSKVVYPMENVYKPQCRSEQEASFSR